MRALSRFPQRPYGKTTRTISSSLKKRPTTALRSTARSIDLVGSIVAGWLTARGGRAFRAGALAATLAGSVAGTAVAQQTLNPLRDAAPFAGASHARPNWSDDRDANVAGSLQLSAPGVQPASANQAIRSTVVPRSTTGELGQDSDFAANGSRLDWRPRLSASERVKQQVVQRQNLDQEDASAKPNDPFRDPFGDAKAVRTVADWTEQNALRGQVSPAVGNSGERRGAVIHAQAQTPEKSVLVARNDADDFPAPTAVGEEVVIEEESVAPLGAPRQQFAQGAPAAPETTDEGDAAPLPAPDVLQNDGTPGEETVEDHLRRCNTVAEFARSRTLGKISLDLTPPYAPSLMRTDRDKPEDPSAALANEPPRAWTNRGGAVLAEGRLVGYSNGFVKIETDGGVQQIRHRDLSEADLFYLGQLWRVPAECVLRDETLLARTFEPTTFTWKASALCHKPLYFEEVQLERYGHTAGPIAQPIISGAHFFVNIATLPYNMGVAPPNECQYVLGYYRPGSCAPWMIEPVPISLRGALFQAGAVVGGAAILP